MENDVIQLTVTVYKGDNPVQPALHYFTDHAHKRCDAAAAGNAHHVPVVVKGVEMKVPLGAGTVNQVADVYSVHEKVGHQALGNTPYGDVVKTGLLRLGRNAVGPTGADAVYLGEQGDVLSGQERGQ